MQGFIQPYSLYQNNQGVSSNSELKKIKQIYKESALQNGNFKISNSVTKYRGLGLFYRSFRCLSACTYPFRKQKILKICSRRNSLSVPSTSLRNFCCASPVHKNSVNFVKPLASKGITSQCLFRRLANQKSKLSTIKGRTTIYNRANSWGSW